MRSSIRRTTVVLLVTAFLIPGILAAGTSTSSWHRAEVSRPEGVFNAVWSFLASFWGFGPAGVAKNSGALDPSGSTATSGSTTTSTTTSDGDTGDNGGALDPSGKP